MRPKPPDFGDGAFDAPKPPPPDLGGDFGLPDDARELFGLSPDELGSDEPRPDVADGALARARRLIGRGLEALRERAEAKEREQELEAIAERAQYSPGPRPAVDPELEETMIPLAGHPDLEEFLRLEQQDSLFEAFERSRSVNLAVNTWAVRLTAVIFMLIGLRYGLDYLRMALDFKRDVGGVIGSVLEGEQASMANALLLVLAPVIAFMVLSQAIQETLGGLLARQAGRAASGAVGIVAVALGLAFLGAGEAASAFIVLALAGVVGRVVAAVFGGSGRLTALARKVFFRAEDGR